MLVALFHATSWMAGTGLDVAVWTDVNTVLSSMRMPLFFALSGLFAAKWLTASWRSLIRVKVLLFLWVLIAWSVIGMIIQQAGLNAAGQQTNVLAAVRDVLLAPVKPPFELWFVWALALFFVVAKASRQVPVAVQLALSGVLSVVGLTVWLTTTTGLTGSAKFYFFFLLGLYLRSLILSAGEIRTWLRCAIVAGWLAVSLVLFISGLRAAPGLYFVNCVTGVFAGVALSGLLAAVPILRRLGRQTLPIYLAHTPIVILISIFFLVFPSLVALTSPVSWAIPPITTAVAIAAALGLHRMASSSALRYLYEPPPFVVGLLRERYR